MIQIKRVYDLPARGDCPRFLVDRLWPRGVKKNDLTLAGWIKAVSPSDQLRHWFGHEPAKWNEFHRRYFAELDRNPETWQPLLEAAQAGDITLVFGARDTEHNNAVALKEYLDARLQPRGSHHSHTGLKRNMERRIQRQKREARPFLPPKAKRRRSGGVQMRPESP